MLASRRGYRGVVTLLLNPLNPIQTDVNAQNKVSTMLQLQCLLAVRHC